jgi:hypothetical protein
MAYGVGPCLEPIRMKAMIIVRLLLLFAALPVLFFLPPWIGSFFGETTLPTGVVVAAMFAAMTGWGITAERLLDRWWP